MACFGNSKCDCGLNKSVCDLSCWKTNKTPKSVKKQKKKKV